jgi:SAM-dependent methyltransferase
MSENRPHARFPAVSFVSHAEFENHLRAAATELDALYRYERRLATREPVIHTSGTCAPCLRATHYTAATAGGEVLPDGRAVPNWRDQFICDCADRLNARCRATLHFLQSVVGVSPWTRLLLFGPERKLNARLRHLMPLTREVPRLTVAGGRYRLDAETASAHVVLALDALQAIPPLDAALAEFRRVLARGGQFVFTVPFHYRAAGTRSRLDHLPTNDGLLPAACHHDVHDFGWDVLRRLRDAGFRRPAAHAYRSEELGYIGPFSMIFSAEA